MSPAPTHYATADMERRHERHGCPNHPAPGVCVGCGQEWPCDARQLLDLTAAQKFTGVLVRAARRIDTEWTAYIGEWDKDGHDDAAKMGKTIAAMRDVLAAIDGKARDPIEASSARP